MLGPERLRRLRAALSRPLAAAEAATLADAASDDSSADCREIGVLLHWLAAHAADDDSAQRPSAAEAYVAGPAAGAQCELDKV